MIVGSGIFGAVCARELTDAGHTCLVVEKRPHIGGNCYTRAVPDVGCHEHVYGPHIFHTSSRRVWDYVNRFAEFNRFVNRPRVKYRGQVYSFPINLMTLYQVFGVSTPRDAEATLARVREPIANPANLEEWCLSQMGRELYEIFIRGYTQKQWQRDPRDLPASTIGRLPIRATFDDNYYRDRYQGIPVGGYTALFERLLEGVAVETGVDFLADRDRWLRHHDHVVYTGAIDEFFDWQEGALEYRSLRFERELLEQPDFQGNAQINYTDAEVPFTRIVEHKHFDPGQRTPRTLITREFPQEWAQGAVPFYPVRTRPNLDKFDRYRQLVATHALPVTFGGRLAEFRYYDMHMVYAAALTRARHLIADFQDGRRESAAVRQPLAA
jgi:UDP-galactopyranose mutase